jgi:hypothetical protein
MKKFFKWLFITIIVLLFFLIAAVFVVPKAAPQFGAPSKGERLYRIQQSPNYREGKFVNLVETPMNSASDSIMSTAWKFIKGGENRSPSRTIETKPFDKSNLPSDDTTLSVTWFGHSTALLRIEGKNLLIDPIFSDHASPFSFFGPQAFPYATEYSLDDLPELDAVLISHDHYDHLDYETILELKDKVDAFYVPFGLAACCPPRALGSAFTKHCRNGLVG